MPLPRSRGYALLVLLQGVTQFGINFALVYWAEQTVPSGLAAVVFSIAPIVTSAFASILIPAERLNFINLAGLFLGFAGVAVVYWSEVVAAAHASALGIGAVLLAAVVVSLSSVITKRWGQPFSPLAIVAPGQIVGALFLALVALIFERGRPVAFTTPVVIATLYLGTVGALAFLAYFYLLRAIPVTRLSLLTYVTPVVAVTLGALMMHEVLAGRTFLGAAMIFAGVALVYKKTPVLVDRPT